MIKKGHHSPIAEGKGWRGKRVARERRKKGRKGGIRNLSPRCSASLSPTDTGGEKQRIRMTSYDSEQKDRTKGFLSKRQEKGKKKRSVLAPRREGGLLNRCPRERTEKLKEKGESRVRIHKRKGCEGHREEKMKMLSYASKKEKRGYTNE